jgi:hypothetical protein
MDTKRLWELTARQNDLSLTFSIRVRDEYTLLHKQVKEELAYLRSQHGGSKSFLVAEEIWHLISEEILNIPNGSYLHYSDDEAITLIAAKLEEN